MDDVARFFGFGSDDSGSQGSVRHTTDVHVGSSETSEVSTRTRNDVALSHGAPVVTREAAPEIDAGALTSALALAAGGLVAIGVRRRRVRR